MTWQPLITRSQRFARRTALQTWLDTIGTTPLRLDEQCRLFSRIMAALLRGEITPSEGRRLSKAVRP